MCWIEGNGKQLLSLCGCIFLPHMVLSHWMWTDVDMSRQSLMQGSVEGWCGEGRCTVRVSCRLPWGAFLQLICSLNTWWVVKVQRGLIIFTVMMFCLSVILPLPTPLVLLFLSLCCPSLGSFMWGQEWQFSSTPDPTQVDCAAVRQHFWSSKTKSMNLRMAQSWINLPRPEKC